MMQRISHISLILKQMQEGIGNGKNSFDSYQEKYHLLAKAMNNQLLIDGKSNQITILSDILSYSQFQSSSYIKEEQIKRFYFEMGKNE